MRPLWFLTSRSLVNGLRRALTSPKRLITTAVIIIYYVWVVIRPMMSRGGVPGAAGMPGLRQIDFPALGVIDAVVFALFAGLSLILALSLFGYRASFKPADVDILFPTPVRPRTVLLFRIVRDYLGTLIVPIFFLALSWQPLGLSAIFRKVPHPETAGYAIRALWLGFILVSMGWVCMGYALSLYVNRNDANSDRRKRTIAASLITAFVLVVAYVVLQITRLQSFSEFAALTQHGWLRAFFFTATPATWIVMGPLNGSWAESAIGAGLLILLAVAALRLALAQAEWMYDQAAVRGFGSETMRKLQRSGDWTGIAAEAARQGKSKARRAGWYQGLRTPGFRALIWKDLLIQWRTVAGKILLFFIVSLFFVAMPFYAGVRSRHSIAIMIMIATGFATFMAAMMASQSGFTELLRRVDLQKPLPFSAQTIVASEIIAKSLPPLLIPIFACGIATFLLPASWNALLSGVVFFPTLAIVICAVVCVIALLFPEIDDPSQRGFRGLMTLLGLVVVGTPGALIFLGVGYLTKSPFWGSIPGAAVNLGVVVGISIVAGSLYAAFNPSE